MDHTKPYDEKMHYIDAELAGHVHKLNMKLQRLCGSGFLCLLCAFLPSCATLEWFDLQHFEKTKMEYISLPSDLNATIGITSYYCVILKMVILHDAIKTIQNGVFVFFFKNSKKNRIKKQAGCFFLKNGFFSTLIVFQSFLWFSLHRTIWNKWRQYQFDWVWAAYSEYRPLVMKKLKITGIWIRKN